MRNERCRVRIVEASGRRVGCGFIADREHVLTCRHVVQYILGDNSLVLGTHVRIITDGGLALVTEVVKLGAGTNDVCALKRCDGQRFEPTDCALWTRGEPGAEYTGLGTTAEVDAINLNGWLGPMAAGEVEQLVSARDADNKIDEGCSGAALFKVPDGPLVGMVTDFQQDRGGRIYCAEALAWFWPGLKPYDAAAAEAFPLLTAVQPSAVPIGDLIREVDRTPQRTTLALAVEANMLLTQGGFVIALFSGIADDLPQECAHALSDSLFRKIVAAMAPDSGRKVLPRFWPIGDLIIEGLNPAATLLTLLGGELGAGGSSITAVRMALQRNLTPLAINVMAGSADLDRIDDGVVKAWADTLAALAMPESQQPVVMFIDLTLASDAVTGQVTTAFDSVDRPWFVTLPVLSLISLAHVTSWTTNRISDDPGGRRARDIILSRVASRSDGRPNFRLRELKTWLSEGI